MTNSKKSSSKLASMASSILTDKSSSRVQKTLAGSVLSQTTTSHQTGSKMGSIASNVLNSNKYSEQTKSLAASLLSQSNKAR